MYEASNIDALWGALKSYCCKTVWVGFGGLLCRYIELWHRTPSIKYQYVKSSRQNTQCINLKPLVPSSNHEKHQDSMISRKDSIVSQHGYYNRDGKLEQALVILSELLTPRICIKISRKVRTMSSRNKFKYSQRVHVNSRVCILWIATVIVYMLR